ncbi:MAG: box helicase [Segetibacter sp.]|nr:box helicase [Segetibacter sp.]
MSAAKEKVETKVGLLLNPQKLTTAFHVLESFHITKSAKGIDYAAKDLDGQELRNTYGKLDKQVRNVLHQFSYEGVLSVQQEIKQRLSKQRGGVDYDSFIQNALTRQLHISFSAVKPFANLIKWYHKKTTDGKKFTTAPCFFSAYKPLLSFEVFKSGEAFQLITYVELNGTAYQLRDFTRHQFLLENGNEYFLLSYKDYQTLEWLSTVDFSQVGSDPFLFSQNVLIKLEADYSVNRNNHFQKKALETVPVNRVLLSELSNSFLMLTPQWLYDGFLVEGPYKETFETVIDGEEYVIKRDKEAETKFVELLVEQHPNFSKQRNGYYYLPFADAQKKQWFLKTYHKLLELEIELAGMDLLQHFRYSSFKVETKSKVLREEGSKVILQLKVSFGKEEIPLNVIQKMLLAGQKAIMLKDATLGILGDEWLQQYSPIIKHGKINKDEIEVSKFIALSEQQFNYEQQVLKPLIKNSWWLKWQQWQTTDKEVYPVPPTVSATLRPYQQKGYEWLTLLQEAGAGGCLADDMGLGKTLQTICFLANYLHRNPGAVNIIVCPSSLIYNWQQELQKFAPSITSVVYHGATRSTQLFEKNKQVIITSYGTIRADAELLLKKKYGIAVIDESHNIKNPTSQITTVVSLLDADTRIALSGTPVVNNTFDLYAQLNFSLPGMFGSRDFFKREYADAIDRYHDEEKIQSLQKLTAPFILRRTKEQVAKDLPAKTESILWCKMHRNQQDLYNEIKDQVRSNLFMDIKSNGLTKSKLAVLQGMLKLRQVCNSPLLLPQDEQQGFSDSIKTEVLLEELKNILGKHKALVFSQFSTMLNLLEKDCDKQGITYFHFDGQTPPAKRAEMVSAFQDKDSTTNLFLISLKAGNSGLTLTAADYVFLFDPWWNTAVEQQAIDRTHRIGQTKNVFAYKMICKDTIEEKIIKLQQKKKQLAEELVSEDDGFIKSLSEEDVAYLFS